MDQFLLGWIVIGMVLSFGWLGDDETLSRGHWLIAFVLLSFAWPAAFIACLVKTFRSK